MIIISAILAIALALMLLHNRLLWQRNQRLMRLADEQADLIQEQDELIGVLWEDHLRKIKVLEKREKDCLDAARIIEWADTGKVPEKEWWE